MYSANLIGKQMDTEFGLYLPEYSIPAPEVQTNYKEIPFRDGAIDKTSPDGVVHYKDREWDLTFKKTGATVSASDLAALAMSVMNAIHGKAGEIIFDDDPNYKWVGRVFVTSVNCENNGLLIVNIHMITHPYKYSLADIVVVDEIQTTSDEYEGSIVSLTGGIGKSITELLVSLSPIQDLHGYSHPWPAGGGKNIYPNSSISGDHSGVTVVHNSADESYTVSGESTAYRGFLATETFTIKAGTYTLSRTASSETVSANNLRMEIRSTDGLTTYASSYTSTFTLAEDTEVKARIVVGQSGVDFGTGITYRFQIEAGSSPSAWTPYSNICPISGRTGLSVYDDPIYGGSIEWNQVLENGNFVSTTGWSSVRGTGSVSNNEYTYTVTELGGGGQQNRIEHGANILKNHVIYSVFEINPTKATKTQTMFAKTGGYYQTVGGLVDVAANVWNKIGFIYKASDDWKLFRTGFSAGSNSDTFAVNDTVQYRNIMVFDLTAMFGSTVADSVYALEQNEAGSGVAWFRNLFPKDYYAYNAGTQTCVSAVNGDPYWEKTSDWTSPAGTVYGGTLDVVTGVLTVDRAMVDLGTLTWGFSTTADNVKCYYSNAISTLIKPVASHNDTPDMISSKYQTFAWNSRLSVTNGISLLSSGQLRIIDSNYQSESALSDFTASLSGVQLCYKLATPLTYQLTPTQVAVLAGTNNIWSTGDSVSVTLSTMDKVTLVNHGKPMNPKINVVSEGSISLLFEIDGTRYTAALSAGEYTLPDLVLFDGSTDVYEAGEGTITYTYPEVSL